MMNWKQMVIGFVLFIFLAGCAGNGGEPTEVRLMTHDSFDVSEDVIAQFEAEQGVSVVVLPSGDAGSALNQAILTKDAPIADVFYGVDNTFMGRALEAGIFTAYESPLLAEIPDQFELDETHRLLPVDVGDVCLNYDKGFFAENNIPVPASLADLTDPVYADLLVVQNPATSSPGLAFLMATVVKFGTEGAYTYLDFWADLRENGVMVTNDWTEAYYGQFTVASDGDRPIVVSYASSPPAEVIFADPPVESAPSAAVIAPDTCFRQIEFTGILQGTDRPELAQALVDFLLSVPFQEDMPLRMFVFPVNENATLPPVFNLWATVPIDPATMSPEEIDANREIWIEAWREVVLQ